MILNQINFTKALSVNHKFEKNPSVAVGVSGGPDSMALLYLLNNWIKKNNGNLVALIVDHKLRKESSLEAKIIYNLLNQKNISSKILTVKKSNVTKKNMSQARTNRYKILTNYCIKNDILHLFIGHHKDDYIETFINRKISGSDFEGLQSINKNTVINKVHILRPLLVFSKKQIYKFNKNNKVRFIQDPSNSNVKYTRPVIRNYLEKIKISDKKEILNEIKLVKKYLPSYKKMVAEILLKNVILIEKNKLHFDLKNFKKLHKLIAEKVIKKIYYFFFGTNLGLRSNNIQKLVSLVKEDALTLYNIKGMIIKKEANSLMFLQKLD